MSSKKREVKLNAEQSQFIFERVIGNVNNNELNRYRLDLADMQRILDTNGHEIPDTNDYETLRKLRRHSIERFSNAKNHIAQFFQYKAEKEIKEVMNAKNTQDEISTVEIPDTKKRGRKKTIWR